MSNNSSISTAYSKFSQISHQEQRQMNRQSSQSRYSGANRNMNSNIGHLNTDPRQVDESQKQIIHSRLYMLKKNKQKLQKQIYQQICRGGQSKFHDASSTSRLEICRSKIKMLKKQERELQKQATQLFYRQQCSKLNKTSRSAKIKPKNQSVAKVANRNKKQKESYQMSQKNDEQIKQNMIQMQETLLWMEKKMVEMSQRNHQEIQAMKREMIDINTQIKSDVLREVNRQQYRRSQQIVEKLEKNLKEIQQRIDRKMAEMGQRNHQEAQAMKREMINNSLQIKYDILKQVHALQHRRSQQIFEKLQKNREDILNRLRNETQRFSDQTKKEMIEIGSQIRQKSHRQFNELCDKLEKLQKQKQKQIQKKANQGRRQFSRNQ